MNEFEPRPPESNEQPLGAPISPPPTGRPSRRPSSSQKMKKQMKGESPFKTFFVALYKAISKDWISTFLLALSLVLLMVFFTQLGAIQPSKAGQAAPLSAIENLAREKMLKTALILDHDSRVIVRTKDGGAYWSAYPASGSQTGNIMRQFQAGGVTVIVDQQAWKGAKQIVIQFLIPILLLVSLFAYFSRLQQVGGADGFAAFSTFAGKGRKKKRRDANRITFSDVAGAGDAVIELREIRDFLSDPGKYEDVGASPPRGVLLVGPPGTGKTLLAKATAGEADATFFSLSGSDFVESLVGVGAARVRDLFRKARKAAPAIIFIDELDAAGRKRGAGIGQGNDEREQTLNQMLVEMDGFDGGLGIVVMAATNRPDILDPALLRPGRFDRQITIDVPDVHGRMDILNLHAEKKPLAADANIEELARLTPGFSGAELANVINEASLLTVRQGEPAITQQTLIEAIDRVVAGPASKTHHLMSDHERWIVAVHEASHAVVTRATGARIAAQKVSIVSRGRQLGTAAEMLADKEMVLMQRADMHRQLCVLMAGLAGERMAFGEGSTGVGEDLHAATQFARRMVTSFGMSEEVGLMTVGEQSGEVFLGASLQELGSVGPTTLDTIDREVERLVTEATDTAGRVLRPNWHAVEELANSLVEHETLAGMALEALLSAVRPVDVLEHADGEGWHGAPE